jgi:hypothetical protein
MRNDYGNRPRAKKAKGGRIAKQFGGGFNRPVRAPVRPLGYKGGKSVKK